MPWLWLFTAVLVLPLGPSWGRPAHAAECGGWNTGEFFKTATPVRVRACLAAGADLKARDENGLTPLHWAARSTKTPAVLTTLVAAGADLTARDKFSLTPLHWAARSTTTPAVITALVAAGADLTVRDKNGWTPLHWAVVFPPTPAVITALVAAGADPTARDKNGQLPWDLAQDNAAVLKGTDAWGRLNDGRF